jgi:hypothetical protein
MIGSRIRAPLLAPRPPRRRRPTASEPAMRTEKPRCVGNQIGRSGADSPGDGPGRTRRTVGAAGALTCGPVAASVPARSPWDDPRFDTRPPPRTESTRRLASTTPGNGPPLEAGALKVGACTVVTTRGPSPPESGIVRARFSTAAGEGAGPPAADASAAGGSAGAGGCAVLGGAGTATGGAAGAGGAAVDGAGGAGDAAAGGVAASGGDAGAGAG